MGHDASQHTEHRDFAAPDEVRGFGHGRLELLRVGDSEIGRLVLQPGWRWSEHVKPIAGTELCEAPHFQYHVAGTLRIATADGVEFDATPGQVTSLPAGHDAWVVGDEEVVVVDWWGASNYARLPADGGGNSPPDVIDRAGGGLELVRWRPGQPVTCFRSPSSAVRSKPAGLRPFASMKSSLITANDSSA